MTYTNPFGYEYDPSKLAQGWSPWAFWNTPQDNQYYNYTNATGLYDPSKDTIVHEWGGDPVHGPKKSPSRDIVTRWTEDALRSGSNPLGWRGDPGSAPRDVVNAAFLQSVARLHRDFDANHWDWNQSGFSGFDNLLKSRPEGPQTTPNLTAGPGNQGAGQPTPTNAAPGTPPPDMSATAPGAGGKGNPNLTGSAAFADQLSADPEMAYQYMMRQLGFDPTAPSRFGDYLKKRFQPLMEADLATLYAGDNGGYLSNIQQELNNFGQGLFQGGAGDFFGGLRQKAEGVLGNKNALDFLGGINDQSQVEQFLNQIATLKYADANPMIQQSIADTLQRGQQQYDWNALQQLQAGTGLGDPYLTWLKNNPAFNKYLGVRFS